MANGSEAVKVESVDITRPMASNGSTEIQASTEQIARQQWVRTQTGATLDAVECLVTPRRAFFGLWGRLGRWKFQWSKPVEVEVSYSLRQEVTVRFKRRT